ncbi:hypothetical protein DM01DRAFT_1053429 [Hesseltinella vesiculosa]|uniref:Uncharacterized protein n=1 Tax=Hesseltinella vesiculosa TaxID=101127 RepID=A0A1X2GGL5_9FUNG|nr:hypothetical protein DM01DRAFT_1053429 [Hesseltinella vesiculosa]
MDYEAELTNSNDMPLPLFGRDPSAPMDSLSVIPWTHPFIYGENQQISISRAFSIPHFIQTKLDLWKGTSFPSSSIVYLH